MANILDRLYQIKRSWSLSLVICNKLSFISKIYLSQTPLEHVRHVGNSFFLLLVVILFVCFLPVSVILQFTPGVHSYLTLDHRERLFKTMAGASSFDKLLTIFLVTSSIRDTTSSLVVVNRNIARES